MADTTIITGTSPADSLSMVSADQRTVLGNGTPRNRLRIGSISGGSAGETGSTKFLAELPGAVVGSVVVVDTSPPIFVGLAALALADASSSSTIQVVGVVSELQAGNAVTVQTSNKVELTEAQWNVIKGGSGGLVQGAAYYLNASTAGHLTATVPTAPGTFVVQVGIAVNSTILLLSITNDPIANS
jgi:hypothetical protein